MKTGRRAQYARFRAMDAGCETYREELRKHLVESEPELVRAEQAGERPVIHLRLLEAIAKVIELGPIWPIDRPVFTPTTFEPKGEDVSGLLADFAWDGLGIRIQPDGAGGFIVARREVNGVASHRIVARFTGTNALREAHECALKAREARVPSMGSGTARSEVGDATECRQDAGPQLPLFGER
jgi:hypothetical protein